MLLSTSSLSLLFLYQLPFQGVTVTNSEVTDSDMPVSCNDQRNCIKSIYPRHWEVSPWPDLFFQVLCKKMQTMTVWLSAVPETQNPAGNGFRERLFWEREGRLQANQEICAQHYAESAPS